MNYCKDLQMKVCNIKDIIGITGEDSDFASYIGVTGTVYIMGVVVDSKGNYIVMYVEQYDNKKTDNKGLHPMGARIFLIKISADGKKVLDKMEYECEDYIEIPLSIEIDKEDNVYITGMAIKISFISNFNELLEFIVELIEAFLKGEISSDNIPFKFLQGFVLKFDANNMGEKDKADMSFYFGGNGVTMSYSLVNDKKGHIWVTGLTNSKNFEIKTTGAKVYQPKNNGDFDVFICKLNKETLNIEYSTYVGGKIKDVAQAIYADENGYIYVTGIADMVEDIKDKDNAGKFNVTDLAFQKKFGGGLSDSFIIKLRNDGEVIYCSYLGGEDNDTGTSVTADKDGNAYVTGATGRNFPIKGSSFQKELGLKNEGIYIAKINSEGSELTDSTYFGGNYTDSSSVIKYINDDLYIYGTTASKDFPMVPQTFTPVYFGESDVFFSRLTTDFTTLKFSSYLGGTKRDSSRAMVILEDGSYLLLGDTFSADFPITSEAANKEYINIKGEGFLFRYTPQSFDIKVNIPDENLRKALLEILNKEADDTITQYNLMKITRYVDLKGKGIKNLEGLQYAKFILGLDLSNNEIEDISKLSQLIYLNYLDLRKNKISNIKSLEKLKYLSNLYLSNNEIEDIEPLKDLTMMTEIKINNNKVKSLDAVSKMKRIRVLDLDNNSIGDLSILNNKRFLSKISALSQKITINATKNLPEELVLKLDFLKKIDTELPDIFDISNDGKLDLVAKTIVWKGITENTTVTFKYKGTNKETKNEYMNGEVEVMVKVDNSLKDTINFDQIEFSTFLAFEDTGAIISLVTDSNGNFFVLYNLSDVYNSAYASIPIPRSFVIKKISSDGKTLLAQKSIKPTQTLVKKTLGANAMAIDKDNNIYIVGTTNWNGLKTTEGVIKPRKNSLISTDCFIMKFSGENLSESSEPIYSTFFGGTGGDTGGSIVVDDNGAVWIGGSTTSRDFPITKSTARQPEYDGNFGKLFLAKLNNSFSKIEYATYLGGDAIDALYGMDIDKHGNVYVTGWADYLVAPEYRPDVMNDIEQDSWNTTDNAYQKDFGDGASDAFVAKFKSNGEVVYVTYLGGAKMDIGISIAVDTEGCPYILGYTSGDFIVTENSYLKIYDALEAGIFILKLDAEGREVVASTYFGVSYGNYSKNIKVYEDKVYIVGATSSLDFETTEGAISREYKMGIHGFFSVFNSELSELKYSTFIGGSSSDVVNSIVIDKDGFVVLAGDTNSKDFPATKDVYSENIANTEPKGNVSIDGFLMKIKGDI